MSELILLEDYEDFKNYESVTESVGGEKRFYIRGVFAKANYPNKNKRVYPTEVMREAVDEARKLIPIRGLCGQLDHPVNAAGSSSKLSHVFTKLEMADDNSTVLGEAFALDTFEGQQLKALIKDKILLGVSTRALGLTKPYSGILGEGLIEVQKGLRFKAIDIVTDPSAGTFPELVVEHTIQLGQTKKFREVWESCFKI